MALKYADMTLEAVNEKLFKCAEEEAAKAVKEAESKKDTSEAVVGKPCYDWIVFVSKLRFR